MANSFTAQTAEQLGEILQGFRRQRGLSQRALGERIGVAQKAISAAERRPDHLTVRRLYQLLGALGVELALRDRGPAAPRTEW
ncbi:MAG TPA: helix-turn-helix domain-containing protein [Myxococcales bacterium]|nr:helix-turn-helix domain-containing protein [Myxococcales bacterium]